MAKHFQMIVKCTKNIILRRVPLTKLCSANVEMTNLHADQMTFFTVSPKLVLMKIKQFTVSSP